MPTIELVKVVSVLRELADETGTARTDEKELAAKTGYAAADLEAWLRQNRDAFLSAEFEGGVTVQLCLCDAAPGDERNVLLHYLKGNFGNVDQPLVFADAATACAIDVHHVHEFLLALRNEGYVMLSGVDGSAASADLRLP